MPEASQFTRLVPGLSWFQVLKPKPVLGPHGNPEYAVIGSWPDIGNASAQAATIPGAMIIVNLCLYENPPLPSQPQ